MKHLTISFKVKIYKKLPKNYVMITPSIKTVTTLWKKNFTKNFFNKSKKRKFKPLIFVDKSCAQTS